MKFEEQAVFVAFNSRVFAVDRSDGAILWRWEVPKGGDFVTLLPDADRVIVCCDGYLWALRAVDGTELWSQPFKGEGTGFPVLASPRAAGNPEAISAVAAMIARIKAQQAAGAGSSAQS